MKTKEALVEFKNLINQKKDISKLSAQEGVELMIDFYQNFRAGDCDPGNSGDMLLFQLGTYDWGRGKYFNYNITRQLIISTLIEEAGYSQEIYQLSLTFLYNPIALLEEISGGSRWNTDFGELEEFVNFIKEHTATNLVKSLEAAEVKLTYGDVE